MPEANNDGDAPLARRVAHTFAAPRRMAAEVGAGAPWAGVLVLSAAVAVIAAAALPADYFLAQVENPVDRLGRPVEVTSSPAEVVRWGRRLQMFSAAVEHPVVVLAVAGVTTLIFSVLGGGRTGFARHFSLAAHAFLISALGLLLTVGWHLATGDASTLPSVAPLLGRPGGALGETLALVNPFTLWMLAVLGVGVAELDGRRSALSAAGILIGLYLALAAALAALG